MEIRNSCSGFIFLAEISDFHKIRNICKWISVWVNFCRGEFLSSNYSFPRGWISEGFATAQILLMAPKAKRNPAPESAGLNEELQVATRPEYKKLHNRLRFTARNSKDTDKDDKSLPWLSTLAVVSTATSLWGCMVFLSGFWCVLFWENVFLMWTFLLFCVRHFPWHVDCLVYILVPCWIFWWLLIVILLGFTLSFGLRACAASVLAS